MVFAALLCILNFILHMVVEENERRCCEISAFFSFSLFFFFDTYARAYIHIHTSSRASRSAVLSLSRFDRNKINRQAFYAHNIKTNCPQFVISPFFFSISPISRKLTIFTSLRVVANAQSRYAKKSIFRVGRSVEDHYLTNALVLSTRIRISICTRNGTCGSLVHPSFYISPLVSVSSETIPL